MSVNFLLLNVFFGITLKSDFDPVEKSNYPLKNIDDIILLNEEVDTFISHNDETYKRQEKL